MTFDRYTKIIEFIVNIVKFGMFKIDSYAQAEEDNAKLEYSLKGFRHFCYLRERQLVD